MDELIISYKKAKSTRVAMFIVGAYFAGFNLYLAVLQLIDKTYTTMFYLSLAGFVLGLLIILANTIGASKPLIKLNNLLFDVKNVKTIEWTNVSQVGIGASYLVFLMNGQKEVKVDLSMLIYTDLMKVKSKVVELCEFKTISYKNQ